MASLLNMKVSCYREFVPTTATMTNYALIDVQLSPEADRELSKGPTQGEMVLVLDRSGSMNGRGPDGKRHIEKVIDAARRVVAVMGPADRLAVIAFDNRVIYVCPFISGECKSTLNTELDRFEEDCRAEGGGTVMAPALEAAMAEIRKNARNRHAARLVLLTDGEAQDCEETLAFVKTLEGQSIACLGFGTFNFEFMNQVCAPSKGLCEDIGGSSPSRVEEIFLKELQVAQNSVACNLRLNVVATNFVQMHKCYIRLPRPTFLGPVQLDKNRCYDVDLPVFERGCGIQVLLDVQHVPRDPGRFSAAEVNLLYDVPARNLFNVEVVGNIVVEYCSDQKRINAVSNEVKEAYEKCLLEEHRVYMEQALKEGRVNDALEHNNTVRKVAAALGASSVEEDANRTELAIRATGKVSDEVRKSYQEGTRKKG
jgi:Ca-activated chloride channel homolog